MPATLDLPLYDRAVIKCHGQIFTGKSPKKVYDEFFAPEASSEFAGVLTLNEVEEIFNKRQHL